MPQLRLNIIKDAFQEFGIFYSRYNTHLSWDLKTCIFHVEIPGQYIAEVLRGANILVFESEMFWTTSEGVVDGKILKFHEVLEYIEDDKLKYFLVSNLDIFGCVLK